MSPPKIRRIYRDLELFGRTCHAQGFGYVCEWLPNGDYRVQIKQGRTLMSSTTDRSPDWCLDQAYAYLARAREFNKPAPVSESRGAS